MAGEGAAERAAGKEAEHVIAKAVEQAGVRDAEQLTAREAERVAARETERSGGQAIKDGWSSRVADNGQGIVHQRPGATGNSDAVRVMNPTSRYPDGYVRYYNGRGQPIGLDGKPGSQAHTHIPRNPDGSCPVPKDW